MVFFLNHKPMSVYNEEISLYLAGPRDFDEGLRLLEKYTNNRAVYAWVQRKRHQEKLIYELTKLSRLAHLKPSRQFRAHVSAASPRKTAPATDDDDTPAKPRRQFKRDELPEDMLPVFDSIADAYKQQRVFHEKMKLAATDADRSALRAELVKLDNLIATGWDKIDSAMAASGDGSPDAVSLQKINNARSAISKMIKSYNPGKKAKLLSHLQILIDSNTAVSAQTHAKLLELNVIGPNTNLLVR